MEAPDVTGFEQYVRQRGHALVRTAALLVGDVQLGEDLVQEVLSRLAPRWQSVQSLEHPEAYVHRALVNKAVSWRRRRSWTETPTEVLPDQGQAQQPYDDAVFRALRSLPPRQRAVVVLRHYLDYTEATTAEHLGCSVGTVKSQHAKAVVRLRAALTAEGEGT